MGRRRNNNNNNNNDRRNKMNGYRTLPCSLSFREAAAASLSRSDHGKDDSWGQPQSSPSLDCRQVPISHSTPSSSSSKKSRKKRSSSKSSSKSPGSKSSSKSGSKSSSKSGSKSKSRKERTTARPSSTSNLLERQQHPSKNGRNNATMTRAQSGGANDPSLMLPTRASSLYSPDHHNLRHNSNGHESSSSGQTNFATHKRTTTPLRKQRRRKSQQHEIYNLDVAVSPRRRSMML